jgi:Nucleotide-diphospho-sugar transferase
MHAALLSLLWLACVSTVISDPASIVNSVVAAGQSRLVVVVCVTVVDKPFLLNFLESLKTLGLDNKLLVVAMDQTLQEESEKIGLPTLAGNELVSIPQYSSHEQQQEMQLHEAPWLAHSHFLHSQDTHFLHVSCQCASPFRSCLVFRCSCHRRLGPDAGAHIASFCWCLACLLHRTKLTQHKIEVVLRMLERFRVPIVFADVDIVFLQKHILTYLEQLLTAGKYDFLMSRDRYDKVMFVNSGFFMVAPTDYAIDYLTRVMALKHGSGQYNFNNLLGNVTEWHHFHMLPIELFNNGQVRA